MNRNLLAFAVAILLLTACRQQENAGQLRSINQCLQHSNVVMQMDIKLYDEAIVEKLKDPLTHGNAEIWGPRVAMIKKRVDSITGLIENLKIDLLKQSDSLRKANAPIVEQLYDINGKGNELVNKLAVFKESIPAIFRVNDFFDQPYLITDLKRDLGLILDSIPLLLGYRDSLSAAQRSIYKKKWMEESFAGNNSLLTMMQLNKIENEVLVTERSLVSYFFSKMPDVVTCGLRRQPHPFAIINSSYVKSGQTVEITAGITQIVASCQPKITINGKEIKVNSEDAAVYSFRAIGKPGKHKIPVLIDFYRSDGEQLRMTKNIEYIIAEK
ncbi:hypothetical protein A4D02_00230 [Niastella koreensis]|uniref:Gliding motility-associated protein GldM first immunoglobulin-like domain-containing protein n=2 Tax=Niastella koreensis TaxID=354356 RepID=G8TA42_NIAKG|nr:hypothetical protein [Niastella koreensis]AEW02414.1 hypothetical protein Niako_6189 [Niastella koreensis GR20-10]OQP54791.1 hypothetical protein A4D02_00230 [Niastella koreensis]